MPGANDKPLNVVNAKTGRTAPASPARLIAPGTERRLGKKPRQAAFLIFSTARFTRPESGAITSLVSFIMASLVFEL
jgi:hypothetical protein